MSEKIQDPWQFVETGQYEQAIEEYTRRYNENGNPFYLRNRGLTFLAKDNYASALQDFKTAARLTEPRFQVHSDYVYQEICCWL